MTFGTKQYKNGNKTGYLIFNSGKKVFLSRSELTDLEQKIKEWNYYASLKKVDNLIANHNLI